MVRRPKDFETAGQEAGDHGPDQVLGAIGERIKIARQKNNLTQAELAERVGCSKSWIFLTEDGQQNIKINSLYRVAAALGIPVQSLLPAPAHDPGSANNSDLDALATAALADLNAGIDHLNATIRDLYATLGKVHQIKATQSKP